MAQITLTIPDNIYRRALRLSELSGRDVASILSDQVAALLPMTPAELNQPPVQELDDRQLLRVAHSQMNPASNALFSSLQSRQADGEKLDDLERAQLDILLEHYEAAQLRKAQAIAEAISRGLMAPVARDT